MTLRAYFDRLDSSAPDPGELFEHFQTASTLDRTYHVLPDARHGVERGTVVDPERDAIVRGYPSIPRILVLDPGVESVFETGETVVAEEKLNGFNVRIADVGDPVAFTRGGYACPYTTAEAVDRLDLAAFFADHPEKMLCAELIGPETPYTSHDYAAVDSHEFRVFGIRDRESGAPLPVERRREICAQYDFAMPRLFGRFDREDAVEGVREAIEELDAAGREGVVLKTDDCTSMVKYTTGAHHRSELSHAFSLPFDYGRDFLFSRVVREAFQAAEFETDDDQLQARARALGESILLPMVETIRAVENGDTVGEPHTVRGDPERVEALLDHLRNQSLTLAVEEDRTEDGQRVVEFVKVAESTRDHVRHYLEGGTFDE